MLFDRFQTFRFFKVLFGRFQILRYFFICCAIYFRLLDISSNVVQEILRYQKFLNIFQTF